MYTAYRLAEISDIERIVQIDDLRRSEQISNAVRNGDCFVAEVSAQVVGFAIMDYTFFGCGFIKLLVIAKECRRQGVGSLMIESLSIQCKTEKLFTSTNESNAPMRKLLSKTGFVPCGQIDALDEGDIELFYVRRKT